MASSTTSNVRMAFASVASKAERTGFFKDSRKEGEFFSMEGAVHDAMREAITDDTDPFITLVRNYYGKQCEEVPHPTRVRDGREMIRNYKQVALQRIPAVLAEFDRRANKDTTMCVGIIPWLYRLKSGVPTGDDMERWTNMFDDGADYRKLLHERFNKEGRCQFLPYLIRTMDVTDPIMCAVMVVRWPPSKKPSNAPALD